MSLTGGAQLTWRGLHVVLTPEIVWSENQRYALTGPPFNPEPPPTRNAFSSPWHAGPQSIDLPLRFGDERIAALLPGQSMLAFATDRVVVGVGTQNYWWGPGLRNALLLSNNAPGFPHLFVRPLRPIETPVGNIDAHWILGGLSESRFFDFDTSNDLRSLNALAVTWQPRGDANLVVGAARAVVAPVQSWSGVAGDFWHVLGDVGHPNAHPVSDTSFAPGRDQIFSLFFRWAFPRDGFETWAEWGRTEVPLSLRDALVYPNHTQGYTLGLQWLGDTLHRSGRLRVQAEVTTIEQSTTYRFRPIGSWYTSRAVVQGYTNRGQTIGATIGPGSSSQWLALDWLTPSYFAGAFFTRLRWLEDARSQKTDFVTGAGWCEHDVSLIPGIRGAVNTPIGSIAAELSSGWRLNTFFENRSFESPGCPLTPGRDVRNKSLSLWFSPMKF